MLEVVEQFGLAGVDGVSEMNPTQYAWYIHAINDRAERKEKEAERRRKEAERNARRR